MKETMFEALIKQALGDVEVQVKNQVLHELQSVGKSVLIDEVARSCAHAILKGIDGVIAACVHSLAKGDAAKLMDAYTDEVRVQVNQFAEAIALYAPLQLEVELAKKTWGDKSKEANAARVKRLAGIASLKSEFQDILKVVIGETPSD